MKKAQKPNFFPILIPIIILAFFPTKSVSQSSCMNVLISLSPCLDYITGNSSTPSTGCCTQLVSVVGSQPRCLCEVINNSSLLGISVNQTQALALPGACRVQTPPVSRCNDISPAGSPGESPGGGSKNVPSTGSAGKSIEMTISPLFLIIVFVYYTSTVAIV